MRSLTDFLATLPGIMPRKTRKLILDGNFLSETEQADIHSRDGHWLDFVLEIGPDAAAAILSAYVGKTKPYPPSGVLRRLSQ